MAVPTRPYLIDVEHDARGTTPGKIDSVNVTIAVPGATSAEVQVYNNGWDLVLAVPSSVVGQVAAVMIDNVPAGSTRYLRARGINAEGKGKWSKAMPFFIPEAPVVTPGFGLTSPAAGKIRADLSGTYDFGVDIVEYQIVLTREGSTASKLVTTSSPILEATGLTAGKYAVEARARSAQGFGDYRTRYITI